LTRLPARVALIGTTVVLLAWGARSAAQAAEWQNDFTLFQHALRVNPESAIAYSRLAIVYVERGEPGQAVRYARECIRLRPEWRYGYETVSDACVKAGLRLAGEGRTEDALAL